MQHRFINGNESKVSPHKQLSYLNIMSSTLKYDIRRGTIGLKTLTKLRYIKLDSFRLREGYMRDGFFETIPQIVGIVLKNSHTYINQQAFRGLNQLRSLEISGNPYFATAWVALGSLSTLHSLSLHSNGLEELHIQLPRYLGALDLHNNSLRFVTGNMLTELPLLSSLDLSYNKIEHVSEKAFDNLGKLQYLRLSNNAIKNFKQRHLDGTRDLTGIDISNNNIGDLDDGFFDNLVNLKMIRY